jgi:maltose alpha-D-glucosyltransferase/alpha-amylase
MDPVYGFQTVNVEAQMRNPSSLLHWMRRMLEVRRQHIVFGTGTMEVVSTDNPSVLAYVRSPVETRASAEGQGIVGDGEPEHPGTSHDVVLCVANLSRFAQPAQLPLQRWASMTPVELLGRVPFPAITDLPYFITLPPYGFYWFGLADRPLSPTGG